MGGKLAKRKKSFGGYALNIAYGNAKINKEIQNTLGIKNNKESVNKFKEGIKKMLRKTIDKITPSNMGNIIYNNEKLLKTAHNLVQSIFNTNVNQEFYEDKMNQNFYSCIFNYNITSKENPEFVKEKFNNINNLLFKQNKSIYEKNDFSKSFDGKNSINSGMSKQMQSAKEDVDINTVNHETYASNDLNITTNNKINEEISFKDKSDGLKSSVNQINVFKTTQSNFNQENASPPKKKSTSKTRKKIYEKKAPVVNIKINLKDFIRQDVLEKSFMNETPVNQSKIRKKSNTPERKDHINLTKISKDNSISNVNDSSFGELVDAFSNTKSEYIEAKRKQNASKTPKNRKIVLGNYEKPTSQEDIQFKIKIGNNKPVKNHMSAYENKHKFISNLKIVK